MFTNEQMQFIKDLEDREYRRVYNEEQVGTSLAFQIRRIREAKVWTQKQLGDEAGKAQETISQLENPSYGNYTLKTLKQLAGAFDLALLVHFVSFGELAKWTLNVPQERLVPLSYDKEQAQIVASGAEVNKGIATVTVGTYFADANALNNGAMFWNSCMTGSP